MLNYLWSFLILTGVLVAAFTGNLGEVTNSSIASAKEAVMVGISLLGTISMWSGLMKVAEKAGLIDALSKKMMPLLTRLFPAIPKNNKALKYIATNMIANMLGVGAAATPAGLKAMDEMQKLNKDKAVASKSMCMFMILNMSSLQIVSVNIIAYRAMYESKNPSEIIGPGLLATIVSTIIGVAVCKFFERCDKA